MSQVIIITDKQGWRYAYRNYNYWDKQKKAPRTWREYLGRVDENGNIIPKKVRSSDNNETSNSGINNPKSGNASPERVSEERVRVLEAQVATLTETVNTLIQILKGHSAQTKDLLRKLDSIG